MISLTAAYCLDNDILGPLAILDATVKLIDNPHEEAFGLAFDGRAAREGKTPGFEFHLQRDEKSIGWEADTFGPSDYTILRSPLIFAPSPFPESYTSNP